MINRLGAVVVVVVLTTMFACAPALAQSTFGSIVGSVQDTSGAIVPGVAVKLTNLDENTTRQAASTETGLYLFLNLKPGRYSIETEKPGFAPVKITNITLDARQDRRVDLTLQVAEIAQTIEVSAAAAAINTENATIASTMNNQQVTQLPLNYRGGSTSPLGAIIALPGVQEDRNGTISLAGALPSMTEFTVDGTSNASVIGSRASRNMYPSSEMLGEFRVSAINNNAEFASLGDVTVTSKGGTNAFHGSVFEYHQNQALDAKTYGAPRKQAKVWNTFGGSLSGPIVRDKTFFFVDYEGNRRPGSTLVVANVPTAAMRAGDLNGVTGPTAVDPTAGGPFPNNTIPRDRLNQVSQKVLAYYPAPNFNSGSTTGNYRGLLPLKNKTDGFDVRIDQYAGAKHQVFGRFSWKNIPAQTVVGVGILPPIDSLERDRNLVFSYNYSITSNILNEFRVGLSKRNTNQTYPHKGADIDAALGLTGINYAASPYGGFTGFNFSSGTGFSAIGRNNVGPNSSQTIQISDNLSWIKGRHTIKMGIDWRTLNYYLTPSFGASDQFGSFRFVTGHFSGNAFANFLLGIPSTNTYIENGPPSDQDSGHYALFAQDVYRVTDKLTLSLGLRWELLPPFSDKTGNIANFNAATGNVIVPDKSVLPPPGWLFSVNACPGSYGYTGPAAPTSSLPCQKVLEASKEGVPQGLRYTDYKNVAPRIGFAWRPFGNDRTVLRAGVGVYTVRSLGRFAYQLGGIATTSFLVFQNFQGPGTPPSYVFPQASFGSGLNPAIIGTQRFLVATDLHFRDPRTAQWNVTLERQLSPTWTARASYVGMNSYHLPAIVDLNQPRTSAKAYDPAAVPFPAWGSGLSQMANLGFANYQNLQLQISHTMASGFYLQTTYDWAKNLTNAAGDAPTALPDEASGISPTGDRYNMRLRRGNDPATRRHRALITTLYELPFGTGRTFLSNSNSVVNGMIGGWQISSVAMMETGPYQTVTTSPNFSQANVNELSTGATVRPDQVGKCNLSNPTPNRWFNIDAFQQTPAGAGRVGNAAIGSCVGPSTVTVAGGLSKTFAITERVKMRFEATFTNILNHPNFAPPATDLSTPSTFGVTQTVVGVQNAGNRTGQLSLRLDF